MKKFLKKLIAITISLEMCFANGVIAKANDLGEENYQTLDFDVASIFPEYSYSDYEYELIQKEMQEILDSQNRELRFEDEKWFFKKRNSGWITENEVIANAEYSTDEKINTVFHHTYGIDNDKFNNYFDELDKFVGLQKEFLNINDNDKIKIIIGHQAGHPIRFDWYGNIRMTDEFFELLVSKELENNYTGNFTNYLIRAMHSYYGYKNYQNYNFYNFTLGGFYEPFITEYKAELLEFKYVDKSFNTEHTQYQNIFKSKYEFDIKSGVINNFNDFYTYKLLDIKNQVGWDNIKKTFQDIFIQSQENNFVVLDKSKQVNLFLDTLAKNSSKNIYNLFTEQEVEMLEQHIGAELGGKFDGQSEKNIEVINLEKLSDTRYNYGDNKNISLNLEGFQQINNVEYFFKVGDLILGTQKLSKDNIITDPQLINGTTTLEVKVDDGEIFTKSFLIMHNEDTIDLDILDKGDDDGDKLLNYIEDIFCTDKNKSDTDLDGLNDYNEIAITLTDPLKADSDDNGITDDNEDFDLDRLTNLQEVLFGSNPHEKDSDGDGLEDFDEKNYNTDPNEYDTDEDGLSDYVELFETGTDPNVKDTNNNGIIDSEELGQFEYELPLDEAGSKVVPKVSINLKNGQLGSLNISTVLNDIIYNEDIPGFIDNPYEFSVDGEFDEAILSFKLEQSLFDENNFEPKIYYINEEDETLEELENQTIKGNVVSAKVEHFSKYIVLDSHKLFNEFVNSINTQGDSEVVFVVTAGMIGDVRPMFGFDNLHGNEFSISPYLRPNTEMSLITGGTTSAKTVLKKSLDKNELKNALSKLEYEDTEYDIYVVERALREAINLLSTSDASSKTIILTAAMPQYEEIYHSHIVQEAKKFGIEINVLDVFGYKNMCEDTGGMFFHTDNTSYPYPSRIFNKMLGYMNTPNLTNADSDSDGLPDTFEDRMKNEKVLIGLSNEENKLIYKILKLSNNTLLDKNNPDSDGDGVLDGKEILYEDIFAKSKYTKDNIQYTAYNYLNVKHKSDPTLADTDKDGENDKIDPEPKIYIKNNTFVWNLERLHKEAKKYKNSLQEEENLLVLRYMRQLSSSYTTPAWDTVGGKIDQGFVNHVNNTDLGNYFKQTAEIDAGMLDRSEVIDVYHLFATLNGLMFTTIDPFDGASDFWEQFIQDNKNSASNSFFQNMMDDLCGWAGDLQTLMLDARRSYYINGKDKINPNDEKEFYNRINSFMGSSQYTFSFDDLLADVDAYNIKKLLPSKIIADSQYEEHVLIEPIYKAFRKYFNDDLKDAKSNDKIINFRNRFFKFEQNFSIKKIRDYTRSIQFNNSDKLEWIIEDQWYPLLKDKHLDVNDNSSPVIFFAKDSIYDKATSSMFYNYIKDLSAKEKK